MTDQPSFTFLWNIEKFNECCDWPIDHYIDSPSFYVDDLEKEFWLRLYPSGENGSPDHVELNLVLSSFKIVTVDYELSFLSDHYTRHRTHRTTRTLISRIGCKMENCPTWGEVFSLRRPIFLLEDTLKVRCRIWTPGRITVKPLIFYAIGGIFVEKSTTAFFIQNFRNFGVNEKYTEHSRYPHNGTNGVSLTLTLSGNSSKTEEMSINFKVALDVNSCPHSCQLTLVNKLNKAVKSRRIESTSSSNSIFVFYSFISIKLLIEREKEFLPGPTLPILCDFFTPQYITLRKFSNETQLDRSTANLASQTKEFKSSQPAESLNSSSDLIPLNILQHDLLSLYTERNLCDFELRTEGKAFPVHKLILSARSPVFKALFASDMREAASGFQDVPDIDKETLDRMLLYIYTGIIREFQWEEAVKLYYAADKYQILSLKQNCSSYMQSNLHGSNVCEALELADRHSDQALNSAVEQFIVDRANETMNSEEWKLFTNRNSQLAAETMRKVFSKLTMNRK